MLWMTVSLSFYPGHIYELVLINFNNFNVYRNEYNFNAMYPQPTDLRRGGIIVVRVVWLVIVLKKVGGLRARAQGVTSCRLSHVYQRGRGCGGRVYEGVARNDQVVIIWWDCT